MISRFVLPLPVQAVACRVQSAYSKQRRSASFNPSSSSTTVKGSAMTTWKGRACVNVRVGRNQGCGVLWCVCQMKKKHMQKRGRGQQGVVGTDGASLQTRNGSSFDAVNSRSRKFKPVKKTLVSTTDGSRVKNCTETHRHTGTDTECVGVRRVT